MAMRRERNWERRLGIAKCLKAFDEELRRKMQEEYDRRIQKLEAKILQLREQQ